MPKAQFYHNARQPLLTACELIARAVGSGRRVAVRTQDAHETQQLDTLLWTHDAGSFIPHVQCNSELAGITPVVIGQAGQHAHWPHHDVLVNLAVDLPPDNSQFKMIVEIVGTTEELILPARARWKQYKSLGFDLIVFDTETRERL